ncbi:MAG TPA: STAS domain-containing protein [Smithellaceae bacterium]|nr:STAS domain-containing protein [Smithellaceae bacterium]
MTQDLIVGSQAALNTIQGCLVVTLQADLYDDLLSRIRQSILESVHAASIRGVFFDMSSVGVLDSYIFNHLADTAKMTQLLGARTVFVGFQPGAVSALVDLDIDTSNIQMLRNIEEGIEYLAAFAARREKHQKDSEYSETTGDETLQPDEAWNEADDGRQ